MRKPITFYEWRERQLESKVRALIESGYYSLLIKKGKEIFGVGEEDRITFARMKDPKTESDGWVDDSSFMGTNLTNVVKGSPSQTVFEKEDIKSLKVIDSEKAIKLLTKQAKDKTQGNPEEILIIKNNE